MRAFIKWAKQKWSVSPGLWLTYIVFYLVWGSVMNWIGQELAIAKFVYWWQVVTVYVVYMVPISILLRGLPVHMR